MWSFFRGCTCVHYWHLQSVVVDDKHATMQQRELLVPLEVTSVLEKVFMVIGGFLILLVLGITCRMRRKTQSVVSIVKMSAFQKFLEPYCLTLISAMGNLDCFPRGKAAATESRYPTSSASCWVFKCFRNPPNADKDFRII